MENNRLNFGSCACAVGRITDDSAAIARANVADGLLTASYYAEWWTTRIAENALAQQQAARDASLAQPERGDSEARAGTVEAALDRLQESERWKVERYLESDRAGSTGSSGGSSGFPDTEFWEDEATAFDLQGARSSNGGLPSPQRRSAAAQYIAKRLLSDSEDEGSFDEECGATVSAPVTPASSAGSSSEDVRSSLEWIPGGMWVASMMPDIAPHFSGAVERFKAAVSPRAGLLAQPPVLPLHSAPAPNWLVS
eukprot:COSAG02_NODE_3279_length_7026_cov_21.473798_6_plen_254_part_00